MGEKKTQNQTHKTSPSLKAQEGKRTFIKTHGVAGTQTALIRLLVLAGKRHLLLGKRGGKNLSFPVDVLYLNRMLGQDSESGWSKAAGRHQDKRRGWSFSNR